MKKYMVHVFTEKGLFESLPKTIEDIKDFVILLNCLEHTDYAVSVFNEEKDYWEDCTAEFKSQ